MDSRYDIATTTTTVIGKKAPANNVSVLSAVTKLRDAYKHPKTRHLVESDMGELSDALVMLALNRYSMRMGSYARSSSNLFPFQVEKVILKKNTTVIELVYTVIKRIIIEQTVDIYIDRLINEGADGVNVIIFGGGLDAFALRLQKKRRHQAHQINIYDIDFPGEMQETKQFALNRLSVMGAHPLCHYAKGAPNLLSIKCDPADETWVSQLVASQKGFNKNQPSIVVGDSFGELTYDEVKTLLTTLKSEIMADESKLMLIFNAVNSTTPSLLQLHSEAEEANEFAMNPTDVPVAMRKMGFQLEAKMLNNEIQQQVSECIDEEEAEQAPVTQLQENFYLMGIPQWANVCELDALDIHAVPSLKLQLPEKPDHKLSIAP
jgi:O-methyltransferase involved in polyketide biosynthesis